MESHLATLKTYITTQRNNGVSDGTIYQSLISSGWQAEIVTQAFSPQIPSVTPQPVAQVALAAPAAVNAVVESSNNQSLTAGRLNRLGFLMAHVYILAYFAIALAIAMIGRGSVVANVIVFLLGGLGVLLAMVLPFFFYARRWHDINQSGWLSLLLLIPGAALPIAVILLIVPGTQGQNNFGTAPQKSLSPLDVYGFSK